MFILSDQNKPKFKLPYDKKKSYFKLHIGLLLLTYYACTKMAKLHMHFYPKTNTQSIGMVWIMFKDEKKHPLQGLGMLSFIRYRNPITIFKSHSGNKSGFKDRTFKNARKEKGKEKGKEDVFFFRVLSLPSANQIQTLSLLPFISRQKLKTLKRKSALSSSSAVHPRTTLFLLTSPLFLF